MCHVFPKLSVSFSSIVMRFAKNDSKVNFDFEQISFLRSANRDVD